MNTKDSRYIHPYSAEISRFIEQIKGSSITLEGFIEKLFRWFDENITYSRLNSPFSPLQRSDIDLLSMKCGTCGDYANLIVSILITMGIPAKYAMISRDCFADEQDHICAAALIEGEWVLIDATLPYRKWLGYNCPHQEYELLEPELFEQRMKEIENECIETADSWGKPEYAGLLYAPWVYDEPVVCTEDRIDSVFYLLILNSPEDWVLYVYYRNYSKHKGRTPIMAAVTPSGKSYQFSVNEPATIWDNSQWGCRFSREDIPPRFVTPELRRMRESMDVIVPRVLSAAKLK